MTLPPSMLDTSKSIGVSGTTSDGAARIRRSAGSRDCRPCRGRQARHRVQREPAAARESRRTACRAPYRHPSSWRSIVGAGGSSSDARPTQAPLKRCSRGAEVLALGGRNFSDRTLRTFRIDTATGHGVRAGNSGSPLRPPDPDQPRRKTDRGEVRQHYRLTHIRALPSRRVSGDK
jgi:hypothetical protein